MLPSPSHTVFGERLAPTLQAFYPDYVNILIGMSDMQAMVHPKAWGETRTIYRSITSPTDNTELS
jgi:hypothetical protein